MSEHLGKMLIDRLSLFFSYLTPREPRWFRQGYRVRAGVGPGIRESLCFVDVTGDMMNIPAHISRCGLFYSLRTIIADDAAGL